MFSVGYGSERREAEIRKIASSDKTTAVILAAVHFEWMLKRTILKLGTSPTKDLRKQLKAVWRINRKNGQDGYKEIWNREIGNFFKNSALGTVLGKLTRIQNHALKVRHKVVHGNGTVGNKDADEAIGLFLDAGKKLRDFVKDKRKGECLDARLKAEGKAEADIANVLTFDEARRIAANVAKLPELSATDPPSRSK